MRGEATLAALPVLPPATVITEMANTGASSPHTSAPGPKEAAPSPKGVTEGMALAIGAGTSAAQPTPMAPLRPTEEGTSGEASGGDSAISPDPSAGRCGDGSCGP